jgi:hypothetical protein
MVCPCVRRAYFLLGKVSKTAAGGGAAPFLLFFECGGHRFAHAFGHSSVKDAVKDEVDNRVVEYPRPGGRAALEQTRADGDVG